MQRAVTSFLRVNWVGSRAAAVIPSRSIAAESPAPPGAGVKGAYASRRQSLAKTCGISKSNAHAHTHA